MLNTVLISVTEKCNYNCKHCRVVKYRSEIDFKNALKIIDKVKDQTQVVNITGGEPLLYPKIIPLIDYIKRKTNLKVSMSTNGHFLTPKTAQQLKEKGLDGINISLDSTDPKKHDSFRGKKGAYEAAERGINTAVKHGLNCRIASSLGKFNYREVEQLIIKAVDLHCSAISFRRILPISKALESLVPELLDKRELFYSLKRIYKFLYFLYPLFNIYVQEPTDLYITQKLLRKKFGNSGGCGACRKMIEIKTNGDVWPCPSLPFKLGNIYKNSITKILHHHVAQLLIEQKIKGACRKCDLKQVCGGCRAWALFKTNDYLETDPYCLKDDYQAIVKDLPLFYEKKQLAEGEIKEIIDLTTKSMKPVLEKSGMVWKKELLEQSLRNNKEGIFWLLKFKFKIVGYLLFDNKDSEIYLKSIIIDKPWQRKKLGFLLIKRLELFAYKEGEKKIHFAVQEANKKALTFFKNLNYKRIGKEKGKGFILSSK